MKRILPRAQERLEKAFAHWGFRGCVVPGCEGQPRLHHIVPRREGGSDGLHNLLPICERHETNIHRAGQAARLLAKGYPADLDGFTRKQRSKILKEANVGAPRGYRPAPASIIKAEAVHPLYKCSGCGATSYIEAFCPGCARVRTHPRHVVHEPSPARGTWRCPTCLSERLLADWCVYCCTKPKVTPTVRPVTQAYVGGLVREVYTDTGEVVPAAKYTPPVKSARLRPKSKKKRVPVGAFHPLSEEGRLQRKRSKLNTNFAALEVQRLKFLATRKEVPLDQPLW